MTSQASFGDASPLRRHAGSRAKGKKWQTPAPGAYDIQASPDVKFRTASSSQFGGNLCKVNRDLTGIRADALRRASDPGPQNYSTEAGKQELDARKRAPTVKFGSAQRSDFQRRRTDTHARGDARRREREASSTPAGAAGSVPGPGAYGNVSVPLAKTRRGSPQYTFGQKVGQNGPPSAKNRATMPTIGPGAYRSASSIGPQLVSTRPSSPNFMMGSSSRAQMNTILQPGFLPDGTAKSPGPSKYDSVSGVGTQLQSKNRRRGCVCLFWETSRQSKSFLGKWSTVTVKEKSGPQSKSRLLT
ncbi:hypothetical protein M885DRAFT_437133 [Pelagophyceae sp. CCMP2097]|nr:hypothetical protein M885DRAFT_437133 [Pelagophyceae sp. CCMP2097]